MCDLMSWCESSWCSIKDINDTKNNITSKCIWRIIEVHIIPDLKGWEISLLSDIFKLITLYQRMIDSINYLDWYGWHFIDTYVKLTIPSDGSLLKKTILKLSKSNVWFNIIFVVDWMSRFKRSSSVNYKKTIVNGTLLS